MLVGGAKVLSGAMVFSSGVGGGCVYRCFSCCLDEAGMGAGPVLAQCWCNGGCWTIAGAVLNAGAVLGAGMSWCEAGAGQ